MLEGQDKRATVGTHLIPRVDGHDHKQRTHIKHQNTHRHRVDGARNGFLRVFRFPGSNTDNLDTAVGEHHHLQRHHHAEPAVAEEATVAPEVMDPGRLPAVANPPDDDPETGHNHDDNGGDLEEGEPELQLAEHLHAHQVDGANDQHHAQHPNPVRHRREPDAHIDAKRRHVGYCHDQDFEAVGPAGDKPGQRAEVFLRVAGEGAGGGVMNRHFAEGAHDDIRRHAADDVRQQHAWTGHFDGICRAIKKTGANSRAQRHKADVARAQSTFKFVSAFHLNLAIQHEKNKKPRGLKPRG